MYNYTNDPIDCPKCHGSIFRESSTFVKKEFIANQLFEDEHLTRSCHFCGFVIKMHTKDHFSDKIDKSNFTIEMRPVEEIEAELEVEELLR